ncbi:DUF6441 family protein [Pseudorhodoplanes sp.]|uniref:DUF6441 family protein n=1 Tax=Pseudorhodoplanes sp. TaxID=1934341 RepID=UPI00391ACA33
MRVKVDLENVGEVSRELRGEIYLAGVRAVRRATRQLEQDLEAQMRGAVPGNAWRAWKSEVYPQREIPAKDPVGLVFGNGKRRTQGMLAYWSLPGVNRAASGGWLAIPLPEAGVTGRSRHLTPRQWELRTGLSLRVAKPGGANNRWALLVTDGVLARNRSGVVKKAAKRRLEQGREKVTRAIFVLIPEQPHANRISIGSARERAYQRLVSEYARETVKLG